MRTPRHGRSRTPTLSFAASVASATHGGHLLRFVPLVTPLRNSMNSLTAKQCGEVVNLLRRCRFDRWPRVSDRMHREGERASPGWLSNLFSRDLPQNKRGVRLGACNIPLPASGGGYGGYVLRRAGGNRIWPRRRLPLFA